jgi:hypothetical protein
LIEKDSAMNEADRDPGEKQSKRTEPPPTVLTFESLVDQRIAQAAAEGLLDNLPGQGQPQRLDDDSLVPEEDRAAFRLLKASGFALPWIEARRDIDEERARLEAWLGRANQRWPRLDAAVRAALRAEYRRKLDDLQRMITTYNLRAPSGLGHIEGLRLQEELHRLGVS